MRRREKYLTESKVFKPNFEANKNYNKRKVNCEEMIWWVKDESNNENSKHLTKC